MYLLQRFFKLVLDKFVLLNPCFTKVLLQKVNTIAKKQILQQLPYRLERNHQT